MYTSDFTTLFTILQYIYAWYIFYIHLVKGNALDFLQNSVPCGVYSTNSRHDKIHKIYKIQ